MKTFKQFLEESYNILERYYEPHERLPSGKTPYRKAIDQYDSKSDEYNKKPESQKSLTDIDKLVKHITNINRHVTHGANNKKFNDYTHPDVKITTDGDIHHIHHPESGVTYTVSKFPGNIKGRSNYSVSWNHDKNRLNMSQKQKRELLKSVHHVYHHHVLPRIPYNSVVSNYPVSDSAKKNPRADIYKRKGGFGPTSSSGWQYSSVNRQPSPRQQAKGKIRTSPINPEDIDR